MEPYSLRARREGDAVEAEEIVLMTTCDLHESKMCSVILVSRCRVPTLAPAIDCRDKKCRCLSECKRVSERVSERERDPAK